MVMVIVIVIVIIVMVMVMVMSCGWNSLAASADVNFFVVPGLGQNTLI